MKKLLYIFFTLLSLSAFGQVGSQSVSGIKYRVNDSAMYISAVATAHAQGYSDIFWNNQATTPHFDVWNGSSYEHVFVFGGSGGGGGTVTSVLGTINRITSSGGSTPVIDVSATFEALLEKVANKATGFGTINNTLYPTVQAVNDKLRATRTVTGTGAVVQTDDNTIIIFNSASPFNFTIDQLTANSKVTFLNYGAGAVTFVAGSGVTITGSASMDGAIDPSYPSSVAIWSSATAVKIVGGGSHQTTTRNAVALSGSNLTLDMADQNERNFDLTTTLAGAMTVLFDNETNLVRARLTLRITGARVVTMPTACVMDAFEVANGRWNSSTNELTLTGITASMFVIEFVPDGAGNVAVFATNNML